MNPSLANRIRQVMEVRPWAKKVLRDPSLRYSLFVFLLTRLLIFAIFIITTNLTIVQASRDPNNGIPTYDAEVPISRIQIGRQLRRIAPHGDAGWYMGLAQGGYERVPFE